MTASVDSVRTIAMALPATTEKPCWGTPAWYVKGKIFARVLEDAASVVVKVDFDERAALVQEDPKVYAVTPHYEGYPMVIVRLGKVSKAELEESTRRGMALLGSREAAEAVRRRELTADPSEHDRPRR